VASGERVVGNSSPKIRMSEQREQRPPLRKNQSVKTKKQSHIGEGGGLRVRQQDIVGDVKLVVAPTLIAGTGKNVKGKTLAGVVILGWLGGGGGGGGGAQGDLCRPLSWGEDAVWLVGKELLEKEEQKQTGPGKL